jgi:hypothetical protein
MGVFSTPHPTPSKSILVFNGVNPADFNTVISKKYHWIKLQNISEKYVLFVVHDFQPDLLINMESG